MKRVFVRYLREEVTEVKDLQQRLPDHQRYPHRQVTPPLAPLLLVGDPAQELVDVDNGRLDEHPDEEVRGECAEGVAEYVLVDQGRHEEHQEHCPGRG